MTKAPPTAARPNTGSISAPLSHGGGSKAATVHGDDESRWVAVQQRDKGTDGQFVYAVLTTGVYCRPSCPSRLARRANVQFYDRPAAAEAAGFRPCKRCTPLEDSTPIQRAVTRAQQYLDTHVEEGATLTTLAKVAGCSAHHLQRAFKRVLGVSPKHYVAALRANRLKTHLRSGTTVTRAMFEAGYGSSSRVYEEAPARLGMTPAAYKNGGRGVTIRYATAATLVGRLLVAATPRGLCAATLGDSDAELIRSLKEEYPKATFTNTDLNDEAQAQLRSWIDAISAHIAGDARFPSIPRDVPGTPFQQKVWNELRTIPFGETRSYTQVAEALGAPGAVRAVANACARNRVAVVVPCHRVIRGSGALGGYRWGIERKRQLLDHEGATTTMAVLDLRPARSTVDAAPRPRETRAGSWR